MRTMKLFGVAVATVMSVSSINPALAAGRTIAPAPSAGRQAAQAMGSRFKQSMNAVGRGLKGTAKVAGWAGVGTLAAYGATLGAGAMVSAWSGDGGAAFHNAANIANGFITRGKDIATATWHYAPAAGTAVGVAGAAYIGAPGAAYVARQGANAWARGGIKADVAFGLANAGMAYALGGNPLTVGYVSQLASTGTRAVVMGLEKVANGSVTRTRW
jgi:hypothetical protein